MNTNGKAEAANTWFEHMYVHKHNYFYLYVIACASKNDN